VKWQGQQLEYEGFLEDSLSLNVRINMAKRYGIKGVAIWRLGFIPKTVLALP
jgi:spore germination protein YaaH